MTKQEIQNELSHLQSVLDHNKDVKPEPENTKEIKARIAVLKKTKPEKE